MMTSESMEAGLRRIVEAAGERWALTPREVEVLELLALGRTNKEIAQELGCQEGTVESHVTKLLRKSATENRTALTSRVWSMLR